jgi:hypothetical protein
VACPRRETPAGASNARTGALGLFANEFNGRARIEQLQFARAGEQRAEK